MAFKIEATYSKLPWSLPPEGLNELAVLWLRPLLLTASNCIILDGKVANETFPELTIQSDDLPSMQEGILVFRYIISLIRPPR